MSRRGDLEHVAKDLHKELKGPILYGFFGWSFPFTGQNLLESLAEITAETGIDERVEHRVQMAGPGDYGEDCLVVGETLNVKGNEGSGEGGGQPTLSPQMAIIGENRKKGVQQRMKTPTTMDNVRAALCSFSCFIIWRLFSRTPPPNLRLWLVELPLSNPMVCC